MAKQNSLFSSKFTKNSSEEQTEDTSAFLSNVTSDELPSSSAALSPSSPPVAFPSDQQGKYANANVSVWLAVCTFSVEKDNIDRGNLWQRFTCYRRAGSAAWHKGSLGAVLSAAERRWRRWRATRFLLFFLFLAYLTGQPTIKITNCSSVKLFPRGLIVTNVKHDRSFFASSSEHHWWGRYWGGCLQNRN